MTAYCDDCGLPESECICWEEQSEFYQGICPNCGAVWSMDEIDLERCYACGYPEETGDWEDDYYPCMCEFCHCANLILGGGVCNECLSGAHQG